MPSKSAFQRNFVVTPLTTVTSFIKYPRRAYILSLPQSWSHVTKVLIPLQPVALETSGKSNARGEGWLARELPSLLVSDQPSLAGCVNSSLPYLLSQPGGQVQHKRIVNLSISSILRYRNRLWSGRPLRNSIVSCSVFTVALENLWILLLKICLKKKIFLMKQCESQSSHSFS